MNRIDALSSRLQDRPIWVADGLLAVLIAYAEYATVTIASAQLIEPGPASPSLIAALVTAGALPLVFRRTAPTLVLVATALGTLAQAVFEVPTAGLALLLALYTVAAYRPRRVAASALAVLIAVLLVGSIVVGALQVVVINVVVLVSVTALGDRTMLARSRAHALEERARELEHEREERLRLAVAGERARIARELHDVSAHGVAVIAMQASGARRILRSDPDRAAEALGEIEVTARGSLTEMRAAVRLLRGDDEAHAPQPGVEDLPALIRRFTEAGLPVSASLPEPATAVAPTLALTIYRIVQESLTNTMRHAGRTPTTVQVTIDAQEARVVVADSGPTAEPDTAVEPVPLAGSGGYGLIGLRERVRAHRGKLDLGPGPEGFVVDARLPVEDPSAVATLAGPWSTGADSGRR